jgi:hypothetical protein
VCVCVPGKHEASMRHRGEAKASGGEKLYMDLLDDDDDDDNAKSSM